MNYKFGYLIFKLIRFITFSKKSAQEMADKTGGKTSVPQIFVDDKYFGGLSELKEYFKK